MDVESQRYTMIPAFGMVILTQNLSTGNVQVPGCSFILSVGTRIVITSVLAAGQAPRLYGIDISQCFVVHRFYMQNASLLACFWPKTKDSMVRS